MEVPSLERLAVIAALATVVTIGTTACRNGEAGGSAGAPEGTSTSTTNTGNGEGTVTSNGGDSGGTDRTCKLVAKASGDGYDIGETHTGSFPGSTVLTGHVNYRAGFRDGWKSWTPPDFTVGIGGIAHWAKTVNHDGVTMNLESAKGTLDPNPASGNDVRTGCGTVTF